MYETNGPIVVSAFYFTWSPTLVAVLYFDVLLLMKTRIHQTSKSDNVSMIMCTNQ